MGWVAAEFIYCEVIASLRRNIIRRYISVYKTQRRAALLGNKYGHSLPSRSRNCQAPPAPAPRQMRIGRFAVALAAEDRGKHRAQDPSTKAKAANRREFREGLPIPLLARGAPTLSSPRCSIFRGSAAKRRQSPSCSGTIGWNRKRSVRPAKLWYQVRSLCYLATLTGARTATLLCAAGVLTGA